MNLFVTGASGLVGSTFSLLAARLGHQVVGTSHHFTGGVPGLHQELTLDLGVPEAVQSALRAHPVDVIVNCAAIAEPALCDADPVRSQQINVELPALLAVEAARSGSRLIHLSSEQVFAGDRPPYRTTDPVGPLNRYGQQKVESEARVHRLAPVHAATVRAPLLIGNSLRRDRSLHERLLRDWASGKVPRLFTDEFRQVCSAENLAAALLELCDRPADCGLFHWAGAEVVSRYDLGCRIRQRFGLSEAQAPLLPVSRADDPAAVRLRPAHLGLDLSPLSDRLRTRPASLADQLSGLVAA